MTDISEKIKKMILTISDAKSAVEPSDKQEQIIKFINNYENKTGHKVDMFFTSYHQQALRVVTNIAQLHNDRIQNDEKSLDFQLHQSDLISKIDNAIFYAYCARIKLSELSEILLDEDIFEEYNQEYDNDNASPVEIESKLALDYISDTVDRETITIKDKTITKEKLLEMLKEVQEINKYKDEVNQENVI